jgi:hypothetical protein
MTSPKQRKKKARLAAEAAAQGTPVAEEAPKPAPAPVAEKAPEPASDPKEEESLMKRIKKKVSRKKYSD